MKFFICIALFAASVFVAAGIPTSSATSSDSAAPEAEAEQNIQPAFDLTRFRKAAYGGASYGSAATIPAPPCPKNYLFSCQPNVAPVACAAPAPQSYGSAGAYSAPIPYIAPVPAGYGGYGGYGAAMPYNPSQYYPY
ncbi:vitelline membrane protein Vm26Aa-like [Eurosta solidaginis]|uniref:vitelline membrane protein Vm26Aa-like n=1 Tax=Eurosta solidaginis TaxID=178769 RepID=UPI003530D333